MARKHGREVPELAENALNRAAFSYVAPDEPRRGRNAYWETGSHPDIVERVWDELGAAMPEPASFLVGGRPVLAHPRSGAILAFPGGTAYALWLTPPDVASTPLATVCRWSNGSETDLRATIGEGWFWGAFDECEAGWCRAAFDWWDEPLRQQ